MLSERSYRCLFRKSLLGIWRSTRKKHIWTSQDVRKSFLDFFKNQHDHVHVPSSSVLPRKGEGTYFINAGMNQFKPLFLGAVPPGSVMADYRRVVNSQKCVRVGGKHNDLDDVGHDLSHHTFFEMLGNWSFGDYFKKEACKMAYDMLTQVYQLPKERLYFTYFNGDSRLNLKPDLQCKTIWLELGIPESHILPFDMKDNFWDMGETGPCGPCTEIHYDHIGSGGGATLVNTGSPDVVEIWNLVFMQYERQSDQTLRPLSSHHVDTGMGLERIAAVLKGSKSNYDTDLFSPLFKTIHKHSKCPEYGGRVGPEDETGLDTAYRILADHTRMLSVVTADGLLPHRAGIGSKLRQIINRAIQQTVDIFHCDKRLLFSLVDDVSYSLGDTYPEIIRNNSKIKDVISKLEESYQETREKGTKCFNKMLRKYGNDVKILTGEMTIGLYEGRYGHSLPIDLIQDLASSHNIVVDMTEFNEHLLRIKQKQELAIDPRSKRKLLNSDVLNQLSQRNITTDDSYKYKYTVQHGNYVFEQPDNIVVQCIICNDVITDQLKCGDTGYCIVDKTHFYSEAGGQMGDRGQIITQTGSGDIIDVQSHQDYILHQVRVNDGFISTGDFSDLVLNEDLRRGCMANHTATHILNAALREILVNDVDQKSSYVTPDKLTFDFSTMGSLTSDDISKIEEIVQRCIQDGLPVKREMMRSQQALQRPIVEVLTLLKDALPERVSCIKIGDGFSEELCCGTHVHNTSDIKEFSIIKLTGLKQSIKGVHCVTGRQGLQARRNGEQIINNYNEFKQLVTNGSDIETWSSIIKQLSLLFGKELVPKVVRDDYEVKYNKLLQTAKTELNKHTVNQLKQSFNAACTETDTTSCVTVNNIPTQDIKIVCKFVRAVEVDMPIIMTSQEDNKATLFICLPKNKASEHFEELLKECLSRMPNISNLKILKSAAVKNTIVFSASFYCNLTNFDLNQTEQCIKEILVQR